MVDKAYEAARNKLIPQAEEHANSVAGPRPKGNDALKEKMGGNMEPRFSLHDEHTGKTGRSCPGITIQASPATGRVYAVVRQSGYPFTIKSGGYGHDTSTKD